MDDVPDHFLTKIEDFKGRTRVFLYSKESLNGLKDLRSSRFRLDL